MLTAINQHNYETMKKIAITMILLVCFGLINLSQDTTGTGQQKPKATYRVGAAVVTVRMLSSVLAAVMATPPGANALVAVFVPTSKVMESTAVVTGNAREAAVHKLIVITFPDPSAIKLLRPPETTAACPSLNTTKPAEI